MKSRYLALGVISILLFSFNTVWAAERAGEIVSVRGKATVEREANEFQAKRRMELQVADSVTTRDRARLKMLFRDDSILTLGSQSKLLVEQYLFSEVDKRADSIFTLLDGKLRAVVGSEGFQVKTPTAYAGARGTIFLIWYDAATQTTGIAVLEGQVAVRNVNPDIPGEQLLNAGQSTTIPTDKVPTLPRIFDKLSNVNADLGEVSDYALEDFVYEIKIDDDSGLIQTITTTDTTTPQLPEEEEPPSGALTPPLVQIPTDDNMATTPITIDLDFSGQ